MRWFCGLMLLCCVGCSPLSTQERVLLGAMVAAQVADAHTTIEWVEPSPRGRGSEANPILGRYPDSGNVVLFKAGVVGLLYGLGELDPEHRELYYWIGIVSGGGAAAWNQYQINKHK